MLVVDTDAASVLAKGQLLEEILELFHNHKVVITPKIEEELEKPLEHGYSYPERVFEKIKTEPPTEDERNQFQKWFNEDTVDRGELEGIAVAKSRDAIFFTMDQSAARYAEKQDVQTLAFNNLAKLILEKEIISRKEVRKSVELIEDKDNRKLDSEDIF